MDESIHDLLNYLVIDCSHRAKYIFFSFAEFSEQGTWLSKHLRVLHSFISQLSASVFSALLCWKMFTSDSALCFECQSASLWESANNVSHAVISWRFFVHYDLVPVELLSGGSPIYLYVFTVVSCERRLQREFNSVQLFHGSTSLEKMLMCHQGG